MLSKLSRLQPAEATTNQASERQPAQASRPTLSASKLSAPTSTSEIDTPPPTPSRRLSLGPLSSAMRRP